MKFSTASISACAPTISTFFRVEELIAAESDPERKLKLRRFLRGLKDTSAATLRHAATLSRFEEAPIEEHESMVAGSQDDLGPAFFEYIQFQVTAAHEDKERQAELAELGVRIAALYEAFEVAEANQSALKAAVGNFQDLLQVRAVLGVIERWEYARLVCILLEAVPGDSAARGRQEAEGVGPPHCGAAQGSKLPSRTSRPWRLPSGIFRVPLLVCALKIGMKYGCSCFCG